MKVETWSWGFSFLCPKCKTWTGYHQPIAIPKRLDVTIAHHLIARFDCETCGEDLSIEVAEFNQ